MAAAIRFRSAVALIGAFPVLAGVDLDVARGEIVLLEGANGAGKTSLLRACAGLLPVISGQAEVLGHDLLQDSRTVRRHLGLLGHATSLYDDLTVEDNVRFATRAGGGRGDAVAGALDRLGLTGRLPATPVGRLSAGQRRRTALAVLVARDPELWLLDEPHAGLDAEHRELLDGLVRDAAGRGVTVVIASHEHDRASALAGRVVTMAGGQVTAQTVAGAGLPPAGPVGLVGPLAAESVDGAVQPPAAPSALPPRVPADGTVQPPAAPSALSPPVPADGAVQPPAAPSALSPPVPAHVA